MPRIMGALAIVLALGTVGCGSIQADYLDVNERAYRAIGAEYGELVAKSTATDETRGSLMQAIENAQALIDDEVKALPPDPTPEANARRDRLTKLRDALDAWRPLLPHLEPDQAESRADSIRAWHAALLEARLHEDGGGGDRAALPGPSGAQPAPDPGGQ